MKPTAYGILEKARKGPLPDTSMPLPEVAPTKGNPLYTEQFKILNNIQSRFHEFIDANEISCNLGIHIFFIKSVFDYWKDRRKGNGNNPLIQLPALNFLASRKKDSSKKDPCNEIDPFLKLVSLRQDLERARALIYLTERRERLKKKMIESVSHIILKSIEQGKSIAFPSNLYSKSRSKLHEGWEENSDGSLSISQTSYCKVFSSPQRQHESYQPNAGEMLVANEVELKEQKCSPLSQPPSNEEEKKASDVFNLIWVVPVERRTAIRKMFEVVTLNGKKRNAKPRRRVKARRPQTSFRIYPANSYWHLVMLQNTIRVKTI